MAEQSLKDKTVKGVAWSGIDNVAQFGVSFFVSIILARLLSPDDYGLLGIVNIVTVICSSLINGGFSNALIRKKNVTNEDYNTTFVINIGISIVLYGLIFFCSPFIAHFFDRVELIILIRVVSVGLIIGAFSLVPQTRLTKQLDFKSQTKITIIASILSGVIGIVLALMNFGVWALVAQGLTVQILKAILLLIYDKWAPRISFSTKSFHELFGFGWKIMVSGLLDTTWKELYQVVVGKYYSPATLGQYTRAKQFSSMFSTNLTTVIQRVSFPVLSDIQDNKQRMVTSYRRIIKLTMFVTAISMFFLAAVSGPFIYCLIGQKWNEAAGYLPLICVAGSLYPLHAINLNMLQVQGRSDLFLRLEIIKKMIALIPLFVGAFVGIMPMLYTNLVIGLISYFLNSHYSGKLLGYSSWCQIKDVSSSYSIAIGLFCLVFPIKYLPISNWILLPLQVMIGSLYLYFICTKIELDEFKELKSMAFPVVKKYLYKK